MNIYCDLSKLKRRLANMTSSYANDTEFLELLNATSRQIDRYCQRHFYVKKETKYFDGGTELWIPDLLSITTSGLKTDEDGNATFENTLATTDYILYGWGKDDTLNRFPKIRIVPNPNGNYSSFASGVKKGVEIAGNWGYAESATPYNTDTTTAEALDASETGVDVTLSANLSVGMTILVESEQMYISEVTGNTITVTRGVNGTTAATHTTTNQIYIYYYPEPITEACIIQSIRLWKRKDSAYQDFTGNPELGMYRVSKGLDSDVKDLLGEYRRGNC